MRRPSPRGLTHEVDEEEMEERARRLLDDGVAVQMYSDREMTWLQRRAPDGQSWGDMWGYSNG